MITKLSNPINEFEKIRDDYYRAWFRFHPEAALDVGVQGYQDLLRPCSDDDQGALLALNEKLLDSLEELDESVLNTHQKVDLELMRGAAFLEIEEILNFDWRKRDPENYLPLHAIYQLTVRESDNFAQALISRLSSIPSYLLNARLHIGHEPERIPSQWFESTMTAIESGIGFLRGLHSDRQVHLHRNKLKELDALVTEAVDAFEHYRHFLESDIGTRASGDFSVGKQRFAHILRYRHCLDIDPEQVRCFGTVLFEQTLDQVKAVCKKITGNDDLDALDRRIEQTYALATDPVSVYDEQINAAREFAGSSGLVSLPAGESLTVLETPTFLRHRIPFAAYEPPGPREAEQRGYYFVTPPGDDETRERINRLSMAHTSVHEAYPGHHLQFVTANQIPHSSTLPRLLNTSSTLYEGWALYCEQLMYEKAFLGEPEDEYILLKDRLWRALRVVLDVDMQTRGMSIDAAARELSTQLGFSPGQAIGEATWYSRAPTVPLGYATGWAMINATRDLIETQYFDNPASFHNKLLYNGSIGLVLGLEQSFGMSHTQLVLDKVFPKA